MENQLTLDINPFPKQATAWEYYLDKTTTELGYGGAARGGKSWIGNEAQLFRAITCPDTRWLLGRKELKNLKRTSLVTLFKIFKHYGLRHKKHYEYNQQDSIITYWTGSQLLLYDLKTNPSDPLFLELGGLELTGGLIEESNEISVMAVNILKTRIGTWNNDKYNLKPILFETFNPDKGHVYHRYYKPWKAGTLPEYRRFVKALPTDNPYTNPAYIEELKRADKITRERLLFGNFEYDDDPNALMDTDALGDLFSNSIEKSDQKYMIIDVARFGMDKAVIKCWKGLRAYKIIEIPKCSIEQLMQRCEAIRNHEQIPLSHCLADEDGVGGGLVDFWHCKGFVGNSRPFTDASEVMEDGTIVSNYQNLRSQCFYLLSSLVNTHQIAIDCDSEEVKQIIIEELEQIKAKDPDKDGKRKIISKDEIKEHLGRSPDYADTLMMRMWFELNQEGEMLRFL